MKSSCPDFPEMNHVFFLLPVSCGEILLTGPYAREIEEDWSRWTVESLGEMPLFGDCW